VRLAGAGVLTGLALAAGAAPLMATLLYGVRLYDTAVFVTVPLILMLVALAAGCIPARRAARVDPIVALRED
jgi:ABC-type antimicrobial peptide transport system permease subunit